MSTTPEDSDVIARAARAYDPEAFEDHPIEQRRFLAAIQWGARRRLATEAARRLVAALRRCDGLVIASPGYHGSISGLLKNALDYVEDMRADAAPYLDGRVVGCIAVAYGPQAMGTTLIAMRTIVHALRAWPTPMAAALNGAAKLFDADGRCTDISAEAQLRTVAQQVVDFANMHRLATASRARAAELA